MTTRMMAGASAAPHELTHDGKTYRFGALTHTLMAAFEGWLIKRSRDVICAVYPEGLERVAELATLRREATCGIYNFTGALASDVRNTPAGVVKLTALLLDCHEDDVLPLMAARGSEVRHLMELTLAESMPKTPAAEGGSEAEGADPNAQAPGAK
jgi:hypothetical protein